MFQLPGKPVGKNVSGEKMRETGLYLFHLKCYVVVHTAKQKKNLTNHHLCYNAIFLVGFECRCGGLFCSLHRYSDKHECKFDYKELGAQEIRKNNPIVVGEKIQKI